MWRLILLILLVSSCTLYKDIDVQNTENVKFERIEGKEVYFTVGAKVDNPNWYGLKIKPAELEVFLDDQFAGTVVLDKKIKIRRKSVSDVNVALKGIMEDGLMLRTVKLARQETVKVHYKGQIKGGTWFYKKKFKVDETKEMSPKILMKSR